MSRHTSWALGSVDERSRSIAAVPRLPATLVATSVPSKLLPPQFLISEIKQRVAREPVAWDLVFQLAEPGDPTDDMTKHWPETRPQITAGRLVVETIHEDQDEVE